jgi:hypothetical protein
MISLKGDHNAVMPTFMKYLLQLFFFDKTLHTGWFPGYPVVRLHLPHPAFTQGLIAITMGSRGLPHPMGVGLLLQVPRIAPQSGATNK